MKMYDNTITTVTLAAFAQIQIQFMQEDNERMLKKIRENRAKIREMLTKYAPKN